MDHAAASHPSPARDGEHAPVPAINVNPGTPGTPQQHVEQAATTTNAAAVPLPPTRMSSPHPDTPAFHMPVAEPYPAPVDTSRTPLNIPYTSSPGPSSPSQSSEAAPRTPGASQPLQQPARQPSQPQAGPSTNLSPTPPPKPRLPYESQPTPTATDPHVYARRRSRSPQDELYLSRTQSMFTPREDRPTPLPMSGPFPVGYDGRSSALPSPTVMPQAPQRALSFVEPHTRPGGSRRASMRSDGNGYVNGNGNGYSNGAGAGYVNGNGSIRPHSMHYGDAPLVPVVQEEGRPPPPVRAISMYSSGTASSNGAKNIAERLQPTLEHAKRELKAAVARVRLTGWTLNIAIGMQILLGALTTGIAAATTGRSTSIATSVLGGMSTLAASYLAKARGSGEPEASTVLQKDLEHFVREMEAFTLDHGHVVGPAPELEDNVRRYREQFEEIMGKEPSGFEKAIREQFHMTKA